MDPIRLDTFILRTLVQQPLPLHGIVGIISAKMHLPEIFIGDKVKKSLDCFKRLRVVKLEQGCYQIANKTSLSDEPEDDFSDLEGSYEVLGAALSEFLFSNASPIQGILKKLNDDDDSSDEDISSSSSDSTESISNKSS